MESQKAKGKSQKSEKSFSRFLSDPLIASAILVFAFVALLFSLREFLAARGF